METIGITSAQSYPLSVYQGPPYIYGVRLAPSSVSGFVTGAQSDIELDAQSLLYQTVQLQYQTVDGITKSFRFADSGFYPIATQKIIIPASPFLLYPNLVGSWNIYIAAAPNEIITATAIPEAFNVSRIYSALHAAPNGTVPTLVSDGAVLPQNAASHRVYVKGLDVAGTTLKDITAGMLQAYISLPPSTDSAPTTLWGRAPAYDLTWPAALVATNSVFTINVLGGGDQVGNAPRITWVPIGFAGDVAMVKVRVIIEQVNAL